MTADITARDVQCGRYGYRLKNVKILIEVSRRHHNAISLHKAAPEETQRMVIVAKLRQVEILAAQGRTVADAIRSIQMTEVTCYGWRTEYGGLKSDPVKRLKGACHVWGPDDRRRVAAEVLDVLQCKDYS